MQEDPRPAYSGCHVAGDPGAKAIAREEQTVGTKLVREPIQVLEPTLGQSMDNAVDSVANSWFQIQADPAVLGTLPCVCGVHISEESGVVGCGICGTKHHSACVGLSELDIKSMVEWFCPDCSNKEEGSNKRRKA